MVQKKRWQRLDLWSERMQGARMMLMKLYEDGYIDASKLYYSYDPITKKQKPKDGKIYMKAIVDWILQDLANVERFLCDEQFYFCNFTRDAKGNLTKCVVTLKDPRKTNAKNS